MLIVLDKTIFSILPGGSSLFPVHSRTKIVQVNQRVVQMLQKIGRYHTVLNNC